MHRIYHALPEATVAAVLLIPFFLYHRKKQPESCSTMAMTALFTLYLCSVYAIAGLPSVVYIRYNPRYNLTPFLYMFSDHTSSLLNVMLFVPLGFFLPVLWGKFRKFSYTLIFGFLLSFLIEAMQIFTYRATDVNDLITNTAGTFLGYLTGAIALKLSPGLRCNSSAASPGCLLFTVFLTMFFIEPVIIQILSHIFRYM